MATLEYTQVLSGGKGIVLAVEKESWPCKEFSAQTLPFLEVPILLVERHGVEPVTGRGPWSHSSLMKQKMRTVLFG